jgi:hypothetical protein
MPHLGDQQVPSLGHISRLDPASAINPFFGIAEEDLTEEEAVALDTLLENEAARINAVAFRNAEIISLADFKQRLNPDEKSAVDLGLLQIVLDDESQRPTLEIGARARLLDQASINQLLGIVASGSGGPSAYQSAQLELDRAALSGYDAGGQPTLGREAFEQDRISENYRNLLETAGLLGNLSGQRTLAGDVFDLDAELGRGRFDLDAELGRGRFGLDAELGRGSLALDRDSLSRLIALDAQNAALERERNLLDTGRLLGSIGGRQTLEAELGRGGLDVERGGLDLARAQTAADFQSNPSNFIAAQLARGGLGSAVGDLLIPGRIAETLFGGNLGAPSTRALTASGRAGLSNNLTGVNAGAVPQGATIGGGLFGENLSIPSLQTLNQLNPEEIQAVGAAVPFLTGGNVTPTQYFSDAQRLGLTGFG